MGAEPRTPSLAIVAGEPSGDLLGAALVAAVRRIAPDVRFYGIAGPRMQAAGVEALFPMERLAVRGYVEVLRHLPGILRIRRRLAATLIAAPPTLFVGVDAPDFNLALEERLRRRGIPTVHFVSPSIWAWRPERMTQIRRAVTHMLALFPFEAPLYEQAGVPVTYVGHPLADTLPEHPDVAGAREDLRLPPDRVVVAMLPGSRIAEVEALAGVFVATAMMVGARYPGCVFLVPLVSRETRTIFEAAIARAGAHELGFKLLFGHAHDAMMAADVVLLASGTATLEAALLLRPMVITYRMPRASWWIMSRKKRLPYAGLPNILAGEFVVPELLQDEATPENLAQALLNLLGDGQVRMRLTQRFAAMRQELRRGAAAEAARVVVDLLRARG